MSQQIVFFDIDGTLLDDKKELPSSTKMAISTLKQQGHEVVIATGRAPYLFQELREELNINSYISFNGQYVVVKGQVILKNPLNNQSLQLLSQAANKNNHPIVFQGLNEMKTTVEIHELLEECVKSLQCYYPETNPNYLENRDIFQSWLVCTEKDELSYKNDFGDFDFIRWHEQALDVLPTGGSKAKGIQAVNNYLGINDEHVYAFGDGLNDIEMLTFVKNSVAMGNATDIVKSAAKYVTKNVEEDGIIHGLQLVGLLK